MPHISFSAFKNWTTCPFYYKLTYEDRINLFNGNEYTVFGTAIHEACEYKVQDPNVDEQKIFLESFQKNLDSLPEDARLKIADKTIDDMKEQGLALSVEALPGLKDYFGDDFEVFSTEEQIMQPITEHFDSKYDFKGFIDLVVKTSDGKYHIVDWKTCSWGWNLQRRSDKITTYQLTFYKHYFCQKHNIDPSQVETHFGLLKRTASKDKVELFRVTSGDKKTANALNILGNALYNIDNKKFMKNKLSCQRCEFHKTEYCP